MDGGGESGGGHVGCVGAMGTVGGRCELLEGAESSLHFSGSC